MNKILKFFKKITRMETMKSLFIPILITLFLSACSGNQPQGDADLIRQQISEYNQQINELTQKIDDLERQLEDLGETPNNLTRIRVEVQQLQAVPFNHYFSTNASVEAVKAARISPETSGQIKQIAVQKGQRVNAGQVVARLNTSVMENSIQELQTALQLAQTVYQRQKGLWEQQIGSEIQYLEAQNNYQALQTRLKTLESQLEMAVMKAPFNGIVDEIFLKEGELAMPGLAVMQMVNLESLYINADISETYLPAVNTKDQVILRFPAFPGYEEKVNIFRLGHVINPENRTFRLQLKINNPGERFKPNMVANVGVRVFAATNALVVPSILIRQDNQGYFVFVARADEENEFTAHKVYIERGRDSEGNTMIQNGLQEGDLIITQGYNQVNQGALISFNNNHN